MPLTKDQIVASIGNRLGISKFESSRIVESVLETVKTSLSNGEDVLISVRPSSRRMVTGFRSPSCVRARMTRLKDCGKEAKILLPH